MKHHETYVRATIDGRPSGDALHLTAGDRSAPLCSTSLLGRWALVGPRLDGWQRHESLPICSRCERTLLTLIEDADAQHRRSRADDVDPVAVLRAGVAGIDRASIVDSFRLAGERVAAQLRAFGEAFAASVEPTADDVVHETDLPMRTARVEHPTSDERYAADVRTIAELRPVTQHELDDAADAAQLGAYVSTRLRDDVELAPPSDSA